MLGYTLVVLLPFLAITLAAPSDSWSSPSSSSSSSSSDSGSYGSGYDSSSSDSGSSSSYDSAGSSYNSGSSDSSGSGYDSGSSSSGSSYGSGDNSYGGSGGGGGGKIISATTIVHATTLTAASSYQTPSYGSGSGYSGSDLQSCLNTCQATFGSGSGSSSSSSSSNSTGSGTGTSSSSSASATHTIIVAPTQGVLRFVPFAVDANQGDAIEFVWGAGPHTATLSDGENVCNRSTTSQAFDSGKLNATATFAASVLSSAPQFHYCTVATHCVQGMFGLINPPTNSSGSLASTAANASAVATKTTAAQSAGSTAGSGVGCSSVDCWVSNWSLSGSGPQATASAVKAACSSTPGSWEWGGNWDFTSLLSDAVTQKTVVENVLYSRLMISMNPSMLVAGSSMSNFTAAPSLDQFVAAASTSSATLRGVETVSAGANGAGASSVSAAAAAAADATSTGITSGAARLTLSNGGAIFSLVGLGLGLAQLLQSDK